MISPTFERAILHINGEALLASIEQRASKKYTHRPLVVVTLKGTILSVSSEAKVLGVTTSMSLKEMKTLFPKVSIVIKEISDYAIYHKKIITIVSRYTQEIEESGSSSYFVDITGMRTSLKMTYKEIASKIVADCNKELGFLLPTALSTSKVLAHLGSKATDVSIPYIVTRKNADSMLKKFFVEDIWNISSETTAYLNKLRIYSAYDLAKLPEATVVKVFQSPIVELWKELRGISVWHDTPSLSEIEYDPALLRHSPKNNSVQESMGLSSTLEKLYTRMLRVSQTPAALVAFEERVKRHLVVPYIGKVS